jgi:dihydrofolate synthase/folylpolyglutamate synthase
VSFCERVRVIERRRSCHDNPGEVGFSLIPETFVARFVEDHQSLFAELQPSFFEITTAMAFCWLTEQKVDIAVIEVGLGGLLDATNIVTPVLSVITNIGMDHTDLLGHSLAEIATQKAGIIKPGVPCVIGETHPQTAPVFLSRAEECGILGDGLETTGCRLWFADQCEFLRRQRLRLAPDCELRGDYQQRNLQTAYVALQVLRTHSQLSTSLPFERGVGGVSLNSPAIAEGFANVVTYTGLRGRWETLCNRPLTICDTGHNSHGVATYVEQLRRINKRKHIVFGMVADKDIDNVLRLLPADATYYFTQPASHRAFPAVQLLAKWLAIHPDSTAQAFGSVAEALARAQAAAQPEDMIFIGGSNYVVGEAIQEMNK